MISKEKTIKKKIISCSEKECPVSRCMQVIGGKWKIIILYALHNGTNRFGALQKSIHTISKQMLTTQLRELERDSIITREIFPEIPPRVEYTITPLGKTLFPIIEAMDTWGRSI
jgi:DNA-binding HxlR family transcriptional regulator